VGDKGTALTIWNGMIEERLAKIVRAAEGSEDLGFGRCARNGSRVMMREA
jgi:hypothetical protein